MPEMKITSTDGTELVARSSGEGTPLVLVSGANGGLDTFRLLEPALAERHTVWVYARRGRGGSGDGPDYSLEREVEDVVAVLDAAGERPHVLGHSGGAAYSMLAARRRDVRSLVLYEPPLHGERMDPTIADRVEAAVDAGDPGRALEILFPSVGSPEEEYGLFRSFPPVWERMCEAVVRVPRELRTMFEGVEDVTSTELPDVPVLYLYGEKTDAPIFATPAEVDEMWPKAQLVGLPGQRHLAFGFDPATFAQAVLAFTTAHDD